MLPQLLITRLRPVYSLNRENIHIGHCTDIIIHGHSIHTRTLYIHVFKRTLHIHNYTSDTAQTLLYTTLYTNGYIRTLYTVHPWSLVIHRTLYRHGHTRTLYTQKHGYASDIVQTSLYIGHLSDMVIHRTLYSTDMVINRTLYIHGYTSNTVQTWLYNTSDTVIQNWLYIGHCTDMVIHRTLYIHSFTSDTVRGHVIHWTLYRHGYTSDAVQTCTSDIIQTFTFTA